MALKFINYDGDLIMGENTRTEMSRIIGNNGYGVFGTIEQDSIYADRINIDSSFCAFVGGLFVQNTSQIQYEIPIGSFAVIETVYTGDEFEGEIKIVSEIDANLVNGIRKHFPIYERSSAFVGVMNRGGNATESIILPANAWSSAAPYTITRNARSVNENSKIFPDLVLDTDSEIRKAQLESYRMITEGIPGNGTITFICDESTPEVDLPIILAILGGA